MGYNKAMRVRAAYRLLTTFFGVILVAVAISVVSIPAHTSAYVCDFTKNFCGSTPTQSDLCSGGQDPKTAKCDPRCSANEDPVQNQCVPPSNQTCGAGTSDQGANCIYDYVKLAVQTLSALVGIAATISIIFAGIQYSSARDDPSKVNAAKNRIGKTVVAVLAWLFLMTFLQWLLPGGIL